MIEHYKYFYDKYKGWYDRYGRYYNSTSKPTQPPKDSVRKNAEKEEVSFDDPLLREYDLEDDYEGGDEDDDRGDFYDDDYLEDVDLDDFIKKPTKQVSD